MLVVGAVRPGWRRRARSASGGTTWRWVGARRRLGGRVTQGRRFPGAVGLGPGQGGTRGAASPGSQRGDLPREPDERRRHREFGFQHVLVATGSTWRTDSVATSRRRSRSPRALRCSAPTTSSPGGCRRAGRSSCATDDHYYLGGYSSLELLTHKGPRRLDRHRRLAGVGLDQQHLRGQPHPSAWLIERRRPVTDHAVVSVGVGGVTVRDVYAGAGATSTATPSSWSPPASRKEELYLELVGRRDAEGFLGAWHRRPGLRHHRRRRCGPGVARGGVRRGAGGVQRRRTLRRRSPSWREGAAMPAGLRSHPVSPRGGRGVVCRRQKVVHRRSVKFSPAECHVLWGCPVPL